MVAEDIFLQIAQGKYPGRAILFENSGFVVFETNDPKAEHHLLVIPKPDAQMHYPANLKELKTDQLGPLMDAVRQGAEHLGINEYRVVINVGKDAGQTVFYLHVHIISGPSLPKDIASSVG